MAAIALTATSRFKVGGKKEHTSFIYLLLFRKVTMATSICKGDRKRAFGFML